MAYANTREHRRKGGIITRIVEVIAQALVMVAFGAFFAWMLVNWATGCGERFHTADGGYVEGECVMMPWRD